MNDSQLQQEFYNSITELTMRQPNVEGLELQPYPRRMQYARDTRRCGLFHKRLRATVWYANNANNANFNKQTLTHVENTNIAFNTKFKTKTTYSHYSGDRVLEGYISAIKNDVLKLKPTKPTHQNASQTQLKALTQLSNNSNIIIQKADKGSKSVFLLLMTWNTIFIVISLYREA